MRKIYALIGAGMIAGMLAGAVPANAAVAVCRTPWHCGWWGRGPSGHWRWQGAWGRGGRWVHVGPRWVYRWRAPPPWHYASWVRGPSGHWRWQGGWGRSGSWVHRGPRWAYRWR